MSAAPLGDYSATAPNGSKMREPKEPTPPSLRPASNVTRVFYPTTRMHVRWAIDAGERHYTLRETFVLQLEALEDGGFFASHATLPVSGWGDTQKAAIDDFCTAFDVQYRELVESPEDDLSPGALRHRQTFRRVVAEALPRA